MEKKSSPYCKELGSLLLLLMFAALLFKYFFVGYQDMDDRHYLEAVHGWIDSPPFIGKNHWHNRLPLVLSIAASIKAFGVSEFSLLLPNMVIMLLFITCFWYFLKIHLNQTTAFVALVLMISMPLVTTYSTIAYPFVIETCMVVMGYSLLMQTTFLRKGSQATSRYEYLLSLIAGLLLAIAFLTRQTSAAAIVALLPLFILSLDRWRHWFTAGAVFIAVTASEFIWYRILTGSWLHRMQVDTEGHKTPSAHLEGGTFEGSPLFNVELMSRWKPAGTFDVHWIVNPYLDFFTTASYGLLMWLAAPAMVLVLLKRIPLSHTQRNLLLAYFTLAITWFVLSTYALSLRPQARYFGPILVVSVVFAAVLINYWWSQSKRGKVVVIMTILLVSNVALSAMRERPLMREREIAKLIASTTEPVYIDSNVLQNTMFFIERINAEGRVRAGAAPAGSLEIAQIDDNAMDNTFFTVESISETNQPVLIALLYKSGVSTILPPHLAKQIEPDTSRLTLIRRTTN